MTKPMPKVCFYTKKKVLWGTKKECFLWYKALINSNLLFFMVCWKIKMIPF